jgi:TolB-like protein/AraC-like DNA-binding protein/tetratricopeptide (TPR) repeat protein
VASFGIRVVDDQGMGAGPISASGPIIRDRPVLWYDIDLAGSQAMAASDHLDFEPPADSRPVPCDLKKAIQFIRQGGSRKISMADLVAHCGVPERTLRKHFRTFMAASPLEYWRRFRLAAAREELLKGLDDASITEVAIRFGFSHFGRFSGQYRRRFGETPSATLRRSCSAERGRVDRIHEGDIDETDRLVMGARRSRERPAVAVLPCQVSAVEPELRMFSECVAQGIAASLCRARSLSVAAPKASQNIDLLDRKRLARELGARYLVTGSIARIGQRIRIMLRLIDATTGFHVWGDSYDGEAGDLFRLQDRVTEGSMLAILPHIRSSEIERAQRRRPNDLDAYGLTMRAYPLVLASHPGAARQALDLLNRAMEIDPDYAPAAALAAWCHAQLVLHNGTGAPGEERKHALLLSERAGILDPDDSLVLAARCAVHTMAGQFDHADALITRVLSLDPTFAWGWERSGWLNAFAGKPETAIRHFGEAARLDGRPPSANCLIGIGCAHFDAGRYEQAALWKRKALQQQPGTAWINRSLSVSYARLGERTAALDSLVALQRYSPDLTIDRIMASIPFRRDFLDRVAEGLNDLGLSG